MADIFGALPLPPDDIVFTQVEITPAQCLASELCRNFMPQLAQKALPPPPVKSPDKNFLDRIPILGGIRQRFFR